MADLSPNMSIITLSVNDITPPINRLAECIESRTQLYAVYWKHFKYIGWFKGLEKRYVM